MDTVKSIKEHIKRDQEKIGIQQWYSITNHGIESQEYEHPRTTEQHVN